MSLLFETVDRTYLGPAVHAEGTYTYLNRSGRPAAEEVRRELEVWWSKYPEIAQDEMRRRFETRFASAFFELLLHELLVRVGFEVLIHPEVPGTTKRPDFLAGGHGTQFYLEAVVASDTSDAEEAEEALVEGYYEEINKTDSPNFFIRLLRVAMPSAVQPSGRRIRAFLERELGKLDPDELTRVIQKQGLDGLPVLEFRDDEVCVQLQPIPKSLGLRGKADVRPIGMYPIQSKVGGEAPSLRRTLLSKAGRYGEPDLPFVVAVNWDDWWPLDQIGIMETLFGTEQFFFGPEMGEPEMRRAPDGLFHGPQGPQYTRVSGVIMASLTPWSIGKARLQLVHNPWSSKPVPEKILPFDERAPEENRLPLSQGQSVGEVLGLSEAWPLEKERDSLGA